MPTATQASRGPHASAVTMAGIMIGCRLEIGSGRGKEARSGGRAARRVEEGRRDQWQSNTPVHFSAALLSVLEVPLTQAIEAMSEHAALLCNLRSSLLSFSLSSLSPSLSFTIRSVMCGHCGHDLFT
jgi:hypothetical protein